MAARVYIAVAIAAVMLAAANGFELTVKANGGCTVFQNTIKQDKYNYTAVMGNVIYGTNCTEESLIISKLYVPGTCVNTRENNVGLRSLDPRYLRCNRISEKPDEAQCNDVIKNAPQGSLLTNLTQGELIDTANVCGTSDVGFFFVKNSCNLDSKVQVEAKVNKYNGPSCTVYNKLGVGLTPGQVAGIVIGVIVAILLIAGVMFCCFCQLRKA